MTFGPDSCRSGVRKETAQQYLSSAAGSPRKGTFGSACCGSDLCWFIGKGRHDLVRETMQALARAAAVHDHVFDAASAQSFQLADDLVWRADQAVRLRLFRRMTISQDMRSASMVWSARHRQDALMELAIAFEGDIFGSLVVGHM